MSTLDILFIIALFLSLYSYILFPLLLHLLAKIYCNRWKRQEYQPSLTIIISAYNEEKDIQEKIENTLRLNYPKDKLEIIVSSDGSTDRTNAIVESVKDRRLTLRAFSERLGKTACLNTVIAEVTSDIILFTDANSMFGENILVELTKNFHDSEVGAVTGWTQYLNRDTGEETTGMYARLERKTKLDESMISSCVGADGAIFAIRRELYKELGANDINDFIIPLNVVSQGKRVILDPEVYCTEEDTKGLKNIYNRQVRITTRTAWAIRRNAALLNLFRFPSFSFFLLSHKVLRLTTPFFLLATFTVNLFLLKNSPLYIIPLAGQLLFLIVGLLAIMGSIHGKMASICKYLLITFSAHSVGCLRMMMGKEDIMWTPKR